MTAYQKEITSLTDTHHVLELVDEDHPDRDVALKEACSGRVLLDIKRNGTVKARMVKRGDLEKLQDGAHFV